MNKRYLKLLKSPRIILIKARRVLYLKKAKRIYTNRNNLNNRIVLSVNNQNKIFFTEKELDKLVSFLASMDASSVKREMISAEKMSKREIEVLGRLYNFNNNILWNTDPVTGKKWQDKFSFDVVFRGPERLSDIKFPWELAKMQYLFILSKGYYYSKDKRYALEIIEEINSWIVANPPFKGIHWISALEVGMRIISFIMVYPFIKSVLNPSCLQQYLNSIYRQTEFVEDNLSESEHANTHLIGEAFTLVLVGLFLNSPKSKMWYKKGYRILSEQISKQVYSDGVDKEQSLNYQRFILDFYYLFIILHKQNRLDWPEVIDEYVEKMTEFLMYSLMPDGSAPSFGDADDARGIYIKSNCVNDYKSLLALGAILFDRPDFKFGSEKLPEEVLWLLGKEGVEKYNKIKAIPPEKTSMGFNKGGYYVMRNGWEGNDDYLIFDCGPLGHGKGGHGHADALSFQLYANGQPVFGDPGTFSYNLDYEWRDYFRSTYAHNTITVDGLNQSEINDRMSWKTFAQSNCNLWLSTDNFDIVDGEHDGYMKLGDPVSHRRVIFSNRSDYYVIFDLLTAKKEHTYDYNLHLHANCDLEGANGMANKNVKSLQQFEQIGIDLNNNKSVLLSFIDNSNDQSINVYKGSENPMVGWYSRNYGHKEETTTINIKKRNCGDTSFLLFINTSLSRKYNVEQIAGNKTMAIKVNDHIMKAEDILFYSFSTTNHFVYDDICLDGKLFYSTKIQNVLNHLYAKDIYNLTINDKFEILSSELINTVSYDRNKLNLVCSEDIVKDLNIVIVKDLELYINNMRYELSNNKPVIKK